MTSIMLRRTILAISAPVALLRPIAAANNVAANGSTMNDHEKGVSCFRSPLLLRHLRQHQRLI